MTPKPPVDAEQEDTQDDVSTEKSSSKSGVKVPEEFQMKVAELLDSATKEEVDYLQDECSSAMSEFYKKENESNFSLADMPRNN